jgi:heme/copper-type cytochrome/quinol oxidase subunit 3
VSAAGLTFDARSRSRGWWGMAMLVASESTLLGLMVGSYFLLRFKNTTWPPHGIPEPKLTVPLVLLGVLVATSVPVQVVSWAARGGRLVVARLALLAALLVHAGYLAMEIHLYRDDLAHFVPQQHAYASLYYTLLGASHAHVALGVLLELWLVAKLVGGLTPYRVRAARAISLYWHAVNLLTVLITLTVLSPAL